MSEGARNGEPACLHGLEKSHALREEGTMMVLPVGVGPACRLECWLGWRPPVSIWRVACPAVFSGPHGPAPGARGPRSAGCSCRACASMPRERGPHTPGTERPSQPLIHALDQTGRRSRDDRDSLDLTRRRRLSPRTPRGGSSGLGPRSHGAVIQRSRALKALGRSRSCESRIASR